MDAQPPKEWWRSSQIRAASVLLAPALIQILKRSHLVDLTGVSAEAIADWLMAALGLAVAAWFIRNRIRQGNDPKNSAAKLIG